MRPQISSLIAIAEADWFEDVQQRLSSTLVRGAVRACEDPELRWQLEWCGCRAVFDQDGRAG